MGAQWWVLVPVLVAGLALSLWRLTTRAQPPNAPASTPSDPLMAMAAVSARAPADAAPAPEPPAERPFRPKGVVWVLPATAVPRAEDWDVIADCRTPAEFAEDHIPGAVNTPALTNEERATVGTLYKEDAFLGKRLGAGLVAANIARHFETTFAALPKGSRVLVYCWRGGERSGSLAHVLSRVGWHATVLEGGYKAYRRCVLRELEAVDRPFHVIDGLTGTGKGRLLDALRAQGANVVDLEGLANHYGSLFGESPTSPQPSQKGFETRLLHSLQQCRAPGPIFLEAESPNIGRVTLPPAIVSAIRSSTATRITVPLPMRVKWIRRQYSYFENECIDLLFDKIRRLKERVGGKTMDRWLQLCAEGDFETFVGEILVQYYDPLYTHTSGKADRQAQQLDIDGSDASYERAAKQLMEQVGVC